MRFLKRAFIIVIVLAVAIGIGGKLFLSKYSPIIEDKVMAALTDLLTSELILGTDPEITLYDDLPFISARFNDVVLMDATRLDTLLHAELCFVRLNVWEVLQGNYTISGIRVEEGGLKLKQNELGDWNYKVWKDPEEGSESAGFRLEDLELSNIHLNFNNRKNDLSILAIVESGTLDGSFIKGEQTLVTDLKGHLEQLKSGRDLELVNLPFGLAGVMELNNEAGIYTIDMGNAVLAGNEMVWDASFTRQEEGGTEMDISVIASALRLETLLNRIWPQIPENLKAINLSGKADLQLKMQGQFTKESGPKTQLIFNLTEGSMLLNGVTIKDIVLDGTANTDDLKKVASSTYTVDHFEVSTGTGKSTGKFVLADLENPRIDLTVQGRSGLSELLTLGRIDSEASGSTAFNLQFKSPLGHRFEFGKNAVKQATLTGVIELENATFSVQEDVPTFRNINGKLELTTTKAVFTRFSGELETTGFEANITVQNPKQLLTDASSGIQLSGNANVSRLDLESLVADWSKLSSSGENSKTERKLSGNIDVSIDQLIYKQFTAEEISTKLNIRNEGVTAHNLTMETMGGHVDGDVAYSITSTGHNLGIDAEFKQLSISRMFGEWDDFGQEFLKSQHLEGKADVTVLTNIQLDKNLEILPNKLSANANLRITNGKLKEFEPLDALSKYIELTELKEVQFDTLTNEISMSNGVISIPYMKIKSSALELNFFGSHGLDNIVDYHADLLLSDLLRRKAKKRTKEIEGHEIIEPSGKTRLFLWIRGPLNDLKIGFDNKQVRKKLKNDIKEERNLLKQIIAEEFGGKEKTEKTSSEPDPGFKLVDDGLENEAEVLDTEETPIQTKEKKKKRGIFGWLKDEDEKKDEEESDFEIEFD
jgi:phage protein U